MHVVLAAVRADGEALQYASANLQGHRGVVLAAVQGREEEGGAGEGGGGGKEEHRTNRTLVYGADNICDTRNGDRSFEEAYTDIGRVDDESSIEMAC